MFTLAFVVFFFLTFEYTDNDYNKGKKEWGKKSKTNIMLFNNSCNVFSILYCSEDGTRWPNMFFEVVTSTVHFWEITLHFNDGQNMFRY